MPQKIIVLIGNKGSGKSTIAGIIKKLKNNCEIKSFAEPIKNICSILGIKNENLYDPLKKEIKFEDGIFIGESGRTMMQKIGTIFRNNFDKNIFVTWKYSVVPFLMPLMLFYLLCIFYKVLMGQIYRLISQIFRIK